MVSFTFPLILRECLWGFPKVSFFGEKSNDCKTNGVGVAQQRRRKVIGNCKRRREEEEEGKILIGHLKQESG